MSIRVPYSGTVRPRVEYVLTHAGTETLPVLHSLAIWGQKHTTSPVKGLALRVECVKCGQPSEIARWCQTCSAPLDRDRTGWRRAREPDRLISLAAA